MCESTLLDCIFIIFFAELAALDFPIEYFLEAAFLVIEAEELREKGMFLIQISYGFGFLCSLYKDLIGKDSFAWMYCFYCLFVESYFTKPITHFRMFQKTVSHLLVLIFLGLTFSHF